MAKSRTNRKSSTKKPGTAVVGDADEPRISDWEFFFRDQRSPLVRSQLITALMAGRPLEVERLPAAALLDAVLLSMTARNYLDAEIVDDYHALLRRADEAWRDPMWTRRVFDQTHLGAADFVVRGATEFKCFEDLYIPAFVGGMLAGDPPVYFKKELAA
jgi:hypothetical protein